MINIVGNLDLYNVTIIGPSQSGKTTLGKQLQSEGYYYLSCENLTNMDISLDDIKLFLNVDNYKEATSKQSIIIQNIISLLKKGYKKIIIDDLLTFVDLNVRKQLLKSLTDNNVKFINITMDIEDTLFADYLIVLFNDKVALEGQTTEVLKEEKLLKRMGLSLPFIIDLSIQLKYYGLVDRIYLSQEELVSELWK